MEDDEEHFAAQTETPKTSKVYRSSFVSAFEVLEDGKVGICRYCTHTLKCFSASVDSRHLRNSHPQAFEVRRLAALFSAITPLQKLAIFPATSTMPMSYLRNIHFQVALNVFYFSLERSIFL